jgi:hypothetical protein
MSPEQILAFCAAYRYTQNRHCSGLFQTVNRLSVQSFVMPSFRLFKGLLSVSPDIKEGIGGQSLRRHCHVWTYRTRPIATGTEDWFDVTGSTVRSADAYPASLAK